MEETNGGSFQLGFAGAGDCVSGANKWMLCLEKVNQELLLRVPLQKTPLREKRESITHMQKQQHSAGGAFSVWRVYTLA